MSLNKVNEEAANLREQRKKERKQEREQALVEGKRRIRIRLIPIWLRVIIIAVLLALSTLVGAVVGYSVMGDGKAKDVLKKETWMHIVEYVNSSE